MSGGGALGLGKSKSQQQAEAYNTSTGFSQSMSQDQSVSTGSSVNSGSSIAGSSQDIAFADLFEQLYRKAGGAASGAAANAGELSTAARQLFSGGMDVLSGLGGDVGSEYLTSRLADNSVLDAQLASLQEQSGKLFSEQLNPEIVSRSVASGTLGGGRQGVAQGIAAGQTQDAFLQAATQLITANQSQKDTAATAIAANSLTAAGTGLGALPSLFDTLTAGNNAELGVYSNLSAILGGPTTLTTSSSESQTFGSSAQQALSTAFAQSFGQQSSMGTSNSSGRATGWNFNMSGYGGVGASGG